MAVSPPPQTIPKLPGKPLLGNLLDIDPSRPVQDLMRIAREIGEPVFELDLLMRKLYVATSAAVTAELCDETRFDKAVVGGLRRARRVVGDALFTAYTAEENWSKAHNILLPNFSDRAMAGYLPQMLDIADQLMLKWERLNVEDEVDVVHDMTALTLDTIGLASFGYRFNSFYRHDNHPFVDAMVDSLQIAMSERDLPFENVVMQKRTKRLFRDVAFMDRTVDEIIRERKAEIPGARRQRDLLDYMLEGVDKKTGERLDDTNIRRQMITFLVAGHETTSGLLSFAIYYLINHPEVLERAYAEVDRVLGDDPHPGKRQLNELVYVQQILKETLRLWPTAPGFQLRPYRDEVVGGKYALKARSTVLVLLPILHRDPEIWGERAELFDPDNFLPEREATRPATAYKPFGNGRRACIGMQFAMQEATLVLGMLLQRFTFIDHARYELRVKESLTIKPDGLTIKVRPRAGKHVATRAASRADANGASADGNAAAIVAEPGATLPKHGTPLLVLYGSNLGASEDAARQLADAATQRGFDVELAWLDDRVGKLPTQGGVVVVCSSYNGAPPDNAAAFYKWIGRASDPALLSGVRYAVFGCGNRNWSSTYQAVPRFLDERLAALGAQRIFERGEGDARDDIDSDFRRWRATMWESVARDFKVELHLDGSRADRPRFVVDVLPAPQGNAIAALHGATRMTLLVNRELQAPDSSRSTRHVEVALPAGASYACGDHLAVVPQNAPATIARVMQRFGFEPGTHVRLLSTGAGNSVLPLDKPIALERLLGTYVELQAVAARAHIETLARHTSCPATKPTLLALAADETGDDSPYRTEIKAKRRSVIDLLEEYPACELPFDAYIELLPGIVPRYYSIASSPKLGGDRCTITVGVVRGPALRGRGEFEGVCSGDLERRRPGDGIDAFVKASKGGFRLPDDPLRPLIMIGPGTGLAPFRGFLQERRFLHEHGVALGPAMLFFGCRNPDEDFIYRDELEGFAHDGLVDLNVAFSRAGEKTYVQHLIERRAHDIFAMLDSGGAIYICGDGSRMEPDVRRTLVRLYEARGAVAGGGDAWIDALARDERYVLDVWANV